jgi:hypothetical protein
MEIVTFDAMRTKVVAIPKPIALTTFVVTAKSGHRPRSATNAWLLSQSPFLAIFEYSFMYEIISKSAMMV